MAENPDRVVDAHVDACQSCQVSFPAEGQTARSVHDRIELPPIQPHVTRARLFGGRCLCRGTRAMAPAPAGLEPGSPFGRCKPHHVASLYVIRKALQAKTNPTWIGEGWCSGALCRTSWTCPGMEAMQETGR